MSTRAHIVRHKAHSHKHMPTFLQLVILWVFNSIRPLLSSTQPFDLREHMVVVHEAGDSAYNLFLISYFKMPIRVITRGIFNSVPMCGHLNRSGTHARARLEIVYMTCAFLPVRNGQRYFANLLCLGAMGLVTHSINMAGSSGPNWYLCFWILRQWYLG